ncbi:hypothetical protein MMC25_005194 [Agyrium rufum]|nr:hypothetical protein [Agyrium rufum]
MTGNTRKRGKSLHLDLSNGAKEETPGISALFLVQFDDRAGYTLAWRQASGDIDLADSVEYKSLPSGLHNVEEDIVYFIHDEKHVGISAFANQPKDGRARGALMLSVGALVPLSHGRLGRSWKLAEPLKELAKLLIQDTSKTESLQDFWDNNHTSGTDADGLRQSPFTAITQQYRQQSQPESSPNGKGKGRRRAASNASMAAAQRQGLPSHHPALSLPNFVDKFGPLIYPVYKAALLRKRILLLTQAPIEQACNFAYDISVLSGIPVSVSDSLPLEPLPIRLDPLFSIGVRDIDSLSRPTDSSGHGADPHYGWVACSTDDVLSTKSSLYDILVSLPPAYSKNAKEKVWPKLQFSPNMRRPKHDIKASQRDLRRYRTLRQNLHRSTREIATPRPSSDSRRQSTFDAEEQADESSSPLLLSSRHNTHETYDDASSTIDEKLIEPQSWSALAYTSFMWWASAGEKDAERDGEIELDDSLFRNFSEYRPSSPNQARSASRKRSTSTRENGDGDGANGDGEDETEGSGVVLEMEIIAYFHRLTALILGTLANIIDAWDSEDESNQEEERLGRPEDTLTQEEQRDQDRDARRDLTEDGVGMKEAIIVGSEDMARMGMDAWSEGDRRFVSELVELYWGRRAEVRSGRVDCCGMRIL